MRISRGLRNNNPLNIRRNSTKWKGLATLQHDKEFFCFVSPQWGYRAAIITLRNYRKIHNLQTIAQWVSRWAPPVENNTTAYIDFVCSKSGYCADFVPNINNKEQICSIVAAMSYMENGVEAVTADVEKGWELATTS